MDTILNSTTDAQTFTYDELNRLQTAVATDRVRHFQETSVIQPDAL